MTTDADQTELLNRTDAAHFVGMSRTGIRHLEGIELNPVRLGHRVYYRRAELEELLFRRRQAYGKLAFRTFEAGGGPIDLVAEHDFDHILAERLWEAWLRLKRAQERTLVIELPHGIHTKPWRRAHGFDPEQGVPGLWALRAIELVARSPAQRERIDRMIDSHGAVGDDG